MTWQSSTKLRSFQLATFHTVCNIGKSTKGKKGAHLLLAGTFRKREQIQNLEKHNITRPAANTRSIGLVQEKFGSPAATC
ncbi:hypothetical protein VIGAN_07108200 [Vigna angularis var. angularis]|uniref:Uncharacterized protein n=1 Tax=Vigna angularis var. angularis TaxID=157739 RepID=A0A0S3SHR2_PHAAN|nr:hypothetical protein VIGAN_07108200 [Vigna angularis var. angularis]